MCNVPVIVITIINVIIVIVTTTSNQIFKDGLKPTKMSMVTALILLIHVYLLLYLSFYTMPQKIQPIRNQESRIFNGIQLNLPIVCCELILNKI